jgi:hypothetical protein
MPNFLLWQVLVNPVIKERKLSGPAEKELASEYGICYIA